MLSPRAALVASFCTGAALWKLWDGQWLISLGGEMEVRCLNVWYTALENMERGKWKNL